MLTELRVQGLAVIADARVELTSGLNVLTGETGAGKSLLVDALALLLGERAESELVRPGTSRAVVEGSFDVARRTHLAAALDRLGIEPEDGRLILKREVQAAGRSRAWVNGSPVTVGVLSELGRQLVDLHGQHETQSLLREGAQRAILDAYAEADGEASAVAESFDERSRLTAEREAIVARRADARKRADYLRHVADEIGRAAPKAGEMEALEDESRRLGHAEELGRTAVELADLLDGDDHAAGHVLGHVARLLASLERIDARGSAGWREMLDAAVLNVGELGRSVRDYAESLELDPARLASVEARRDILSRLDQKYGPGLDRVLAAGEEAQRELSLLDTADSDLGELDRAIAEIERTFVERCKALGAKRRSAAKRLGVAVSQHLGDLGMPGGTFRVALDRVEAPTRHGAEGAAFLCTLNPGMGERPVAKAASGGELSRLMLALKVELARHDRVPTLVFDEVDTGIGGHVADRVAEALARVGESHQVLVITHLAPIAAAAARHLIVAKGGESGVAQTDVMIAHGEDRVEEVARMLGGAQTTARKHAQEMLRGH
ncbi:MAG: DNA repair protein RecN [Gemmatimonadales bacterium]